MIATRYLPFVGRLMIGIPFAMSGLSKLGAYGATTAMIGAAGLPFPPLAFVIAVAVELGGGLLLVAGYHTRYVAGILAAFALATAVSFHSNFADQNQMIHFLKNVMMAGGLLQIVTFGAGALSVDNRRNRRRTQERSRRHRADVCRRTGGLATKIMRPGNIVGGGYDGRRFQERRHATLEHESGTD